jgi:hypothetical protein
VAAFAEERRFDLVAAPGLTAAEANRFNVLPDDAYHPMATAILAGEPPSRDHPFDISPPTDDRPFFAHFFTWRQASEILDTLGRTWQPFGGAGYFVMFAMLILAIAAAALLVVLPLAAAALRRRHTGTAAWGDRWWTVGYFGLLGIGFLFVEIPVIQRYILLTGRPTSSLAVVLFALLLSSGVGSALSRRVPWRLAALTVAALGAAYPRIVAVVTDAVLPFPVWARFAVGAAVVAPLGFLMGTLFPRGVAHLEGRAAHLVPWAWGINGSLSVVSAVGAALVAVGAGFATVVWLGSACYLLVAVLARPTARPA